MTRSQFGLLSGACAAILLLGCATQPDTAVFVTKTSLSLLDMDSVPSSVSIAYDRVEGYFGPRFDDGTVFPVVSSLETDGGLLDRKIKQVFATGAAATLVTGTEPRCNCSATPPGKELEGNKVVLFGTGTVLGVKFGFAENLPSLTLGFKRREAALIPVDKWRQPSVLASFDNLTAAGVPAGAASVPAGLASAPASQFRLEQFFATGAAAENLARMRGMREVFQDKAERAIGEVEKYRSEEARQGRLALDTLSCFSKVGDDKLDLVWSNAEALGVFGDLGTVGRIRAEPAQPGQRQKQRQIYTGELGLLDAASPSYTVLLGLHKKSVCDLSASKA
jgi:hypothetical protein